MSVAFLFGVGVLLAVPAVRVEGNARCPSADEVGARVAELLPGAFVNDAPDVVRINETGAGFHLSLRRPDGALVGERVLAGGSSCDDLAQAAAVVVAVWQSEARPEFAQRLEGATVRATAAAGPARAGAFALDVGAGVLGSVTAGADRARPAAGLAIAAGGTVASAGRARWGLRGALSGTTTREMPLGGGGFRWQRFALALGPQLRLGASAPGARRWSVDVHAEGMLALLRIHGVNFATSRPSRSTDPGAGAGVRVLRRVGQSVIWLDLSVARWLREQLAIADLGAAVVAVPRNEGMLALGVSWCNGL